MVYEVQAGRGCQKLNEGLSREILAMQEALLQSGRVIALDSARVKNLAFQVDGWKSQFDNASELYTIQKEKNRKKLRKARRIIVAESVGIVILFVLLL